MNGWDDRDAEILAGLRDLYSTVDPPAPDLVARVQFAVQIDGVSRLVVTPSIVV